MPIEDIRSKNPSYEELAEAYGDLVKDYNSLEIDREQAESRVFQAENEAMGERIIKENFDVKLNRVYSQIKSLDDNKNITLAEIKNNFRNIISDLLRAD
jgi:hypothetical protein